MVEHITSFCQKCNREHTARIEHLTLWIDLIILHDNNDAFLPNEDVVIKKEKCGARQKDMVCTLDKGHVGHHHREGYGHW